MEKELKVEVEEDHGGVKEVLVVVEEMIEEAFGRRSIGNG